MTCILNYGALCQEKADWKMDGEIYKELEKEKTIEKDKTITKLFISPHYKIHFCQFFLHKEI